LILALQTTTFSAHGGIPAYNRMVCRTLNELQDLAGRSPRVLIGTDRRSEVAVAAKLFSHLTLESFGGNRFSFVRRVAATALKDRPELALIGHVNYAPLGLMLKRLRPHLRYGVMVHGVEAWSRLPRIKQRALRAADFVMSVSDYTRERIVAASGINPERVYLLPNALAWEDEAGSEFRVSSSESRKPGIRLFSVCRFDAGEQYKGIDTVIRALPAVLARVPDLEYAVAGGGSDLERHQRLAIEMGVAAKVHFLGPVDDVGLRERYQACDAFILPSDGEGFGIVYLEAMHYGKPVIAANSRAVPEVVKHNQTGLLVDYGNKEQLAEAIVRLSLNPSLREQFGRAGRERLQQNFTFDSFKQKLERIILSEMPATKTSVCA